MNFRWFHLLLLSVVLLGGCNGQSWNSPHPVAEKDADILYSSFAERPKHLDPAQSYSSNEVVFTGQIYEPPLQYHYLKRPYQLIPLTATKMPVPFYLDIDGNLLPDTAADSAITFSVYDIEIKQGIRYQPHPAFAKKADGALRYFPLADSQLNSINTLSDFAEIGSRELLASDYVYQVKRLAHPDLHSPIYGIMAEYIVGLEGYAGRLKEVREAMPENAFLNLDDYPLEGVSVIDDYHYRIKLKGKYPQFIYWLAMPFFAPLAPEVDQFYSQPGMKEKNLTLDWYPVGTGPYMLTVNNPNRQMVLERNPFFHDETYPLDGEKEDKDNDLLADAGKLLPQIDKVVYTLEKEAIPTWNKFLQGYYDASGISSDSFDQAIQIGSSGDISLTEEMQERGIRLSTAVQTSIFYTGFNMLDPVVGGMSEKARLLRQAIAIAVDYEEYIAIFANGRGIAAQSPLPPGIFGHGKGRDAINEYVYEWVNNQPIRKSIEVARELLAKAGYPDGRDRDNGKPLVLNLDTTASGPDDKARLDWIRKQFAKLDIQLVIRSTDYNRFQDKMTRGTAQIFQWGWNADYPDPENFLFLLYGKNSKVEHNGENAANYLNEEFDRLFEKMKNMDNGPARQQVIDQMVEMLRHDSPWLFGFHPKQFSLFHDWVFNTKPNLMANNTLKYRRIDPELRASKRDAWNSPVLWPLSLVFLLIVLSILPAYLGYKRHEQSSEAG
ncbi:MAG: ABC transporter substrate-binding protein [Gammaproteobacteria bacterium]